MSNISIIMVSLVAGIWNVLHEKFVSLKRSVCVFVLGATFCYGAAMVVNVYGFNNEVSAVIGYLCGITSVTIYDVIVSCLQKLPKIVEHKLLDKNK